MTAAKNLVCMGIDLTAGRRPFTYVALDSNQRLLVIGQGELQEVLAFSAGQSCAVIAINAPAQLNRGRMSQEDNRRRFDPPPPPGRWTDLRQVEYELHLKGVFTFRTPQQMAHCPEWMRRGFALYQHLHTWGYQPYPTENISLQWLEVPAEAAYWALLGCPPLDGRTLEGRLQRQLILYDHGLPVADPMRFFEEVTHHRLLKGNLPLEGIYTPQELNAWVNAYTAWLAATHPQRLQCLGAPEEGIIHLPYFLEAQSGML